MDGNAPPTNREGAVTLECIKTGTTFKLRINVALDNRLSSGSKEQDRAKLVEEAVKEWNDELAVLDKTVKIELETMTDKFSVMQGKKLCQDPNQYGTDPLHDVFSTDVIAGLDANVGSTGKPPVDKANEIGWINTTAMPPSVGMPLLNTDVFAITKRISDQSGFVQSALLYYFTHWGQQGALGGVKQCNPIPYSFDSDAGMKPLSYHWKTVIKHEIGHVLGLPDRFTPPPPPGMPPPPGSRSVMSTLGVGEELSISDWERSELALRYGVNKKCGNL
jgi:hypothetical protein